MNAKPDPTQIIPSDNHVSSESTSENNGQMSSDSRPDELTDLSGAELTHVDGGRAAVNASAGLNRISHGSGIDSPYF